MTFKRYCPDRRTHKTDRSTALLGHHT